MCGPSNEHLVSGYIDLLVTSSSPTLIIDFKTDVPPLSACDISQLYVQQMKAYQAMIGQPSQAGLLFTADGFIRWL